MERREAVLRSRCRNRPGCSRLLSLRRERRVRHIRRALLLVASSFAAAAFAVVPTTASADYPSTVVADHPVSYWRMNDGSGTVAHDTQHVDDGSLQGGTTFSAEAPITGGGSVIGPITVSGAGSNGLQPAQWTLELWEKIAAPPSASYTSLFRARAYGWALSMEAGGKVAGWVDVSNSQSYSVESPENVADGKWHYVVLSYDGQTLTLYVDGARSNSTSAPGSTYYCCDNEDIIGADTDWGYQPFYGNLSEVAVYNFALSPAQVAAHYAAAGAQPPPPPPTPPTIASVSPSWAPYTGGTTITIKGANLGTSPYVLFTDSCLISFFFVKQATIISASPTQIVVSSPSADSPALPYGLYNVALMNGPGCLEVFTAAGKASYSFTYVVPQIGWLYFRTRAGADQCTAAAVQSRNQSVVLTAAHCIHGSAETHPPFQESYDYAFAPGYFGPGCKPTKGSSSFLMGQTCRGKAPYGIWCAKSTTAEDPGCGNTSGTATVMRHYTTNVHTQDFGFIVMPRKNGMTLGQNIGGELPIKFGVGPHANQSWYIFGYSDASGGYLDTCYAPTLFYQGDGAAASLTVGNFLVPRADGGNGDPACTFVVPGRSGGAWLNAQNGTTYGVGAVNFAGPTVNPLGTVDGTYMGSDAQSLWNSVQGSTVTVAVAAASVSTLGIATVTVNCGSSSPCTGTALLSTTGAQLARAGKHLRVVVLGKARFTIPAESQSAIRIRLTRRAAKLLRKHHNVFHATLTVKTRDGGQASTPVTLRVASQLGGRRAGV
jgi:Concanavalin A-like lectin/glucanases superfamily/IPT/TIG domain